MSLDGRTALALLNLKLVSARECMLYFTFSTFHRLGQCPKNGRQDSDAREPQESAGAVRRRY